MYFKEDPEKLNRGEGYYKIDSLGHIVKDIQLEEGIKREKEKIKGIIERIEYLLDKYPEKHLNNSYAKIQFYYQWEFMGLSEWILNLETLDKIISICENAENIRRSAQKAKEAFKEGRNYKYSKFIPDDEIEESMKEREKAIRRAIKQVKL